MKLKAIIPVGGRGTRMQPLTFSTNKHFIPLANKLLIHYPIETVVDAGIRDILITYNPGQLELVRDLLGDGRMFGAKFTYILQEKPIGLANIFQVCEHALEGSPFLLHLGDNIFTQGIKPYIKTFLKNKPNGLVTMVEHEHNNRMGVPYFDELGNLVRYEEKPQNPPHKYAIPGLYFFDKNIFNCFKGKNAIKPSDRGELEISAPYQWLIDNGYTVRVVEYKGKWLDPGKFNDWIESNRYILRKMILPHLDRELPSSVKVTGKIHVGQGSFITDSEIVGPVIIGDNVVISNSYIGPHTSIYHDCQIINSTIEDSILMQGSKILNVNRRIENTMIGKECEIVGNGSKKTSLFVGDKSKIFI